MSRITQATTEVPHQNLTIRAPQEWLDKLDAWRTAQPVPPKRADVIRLAVLQFIGREDFIDRQNKRKR